jgi:hypothetical protein
MEKFNKMGKLPDIQIGQGRKNVFTPMPQTEPPTPKKTPVQPSSMPQKSASPPPADKPADVVNGLVFEQKERGRGINYYLRQSTIDKLEQAASARDVKPSNLLEALINQVL